MKYIKQITVIMLISFAGEGLHALLPLPVPASIYGLVLMLALLISGILPLSKVEETADFLVSIMPVMFIPAAVGLLGAWGILRPVLLPVGVITAAVTVIVMAVTGGLTQFFRRGAFAMRLYHRPFCPEPHEKEHLQSAAYRHCADHGIPAGQRHKL